MLTQLWTGGYLLDWSGLMVEFTGGALAAFAILPANRLPSASDPDRLRVSDAFVILQARQLRFGLMILAFGCLLQCAGTCKAALPFFAK